MNLRRLGGPILFVPRLLAAVRRRIATAAMTSLCRLTFGAVGSGTRVQWGVRVIEPSQVRLGRNCLVWRGVTISADGASGQVVLGDGVQINADVRIDASGDLTIGDGSLVSEGTVIYTHDHGLDPASVPTVLNKRIGANVWIGMRSIILARCDEIGDSAVIGAGSVVTKRVPAGAVVAGSPARIIGWRNDAARQAAP